jgi:hypothetical protein
MSPRRVRTCRYAEARIQSHVLADCNEFASEAVTANGDLITASAMARAQLGPARRRPVLAFALAALVFAEANA